MEFSYQIIDDDGEPTGLWAAGLSTNHRGAWFSADSRCAIYDGDPLEGRGRLDGSQPITDSEFFCTATGYFLHWDGHYHTDFRVGRY